MSSTAKKFFIASLIYFVFGLLAQAITVFDTWLGFNPLAYTTITTTEQIFLIGWLSQVALALVYDRWLPLAQFGATVFVLLNVGLPLTLIGQPGVALWGGNWVGIVAVLGSLLQLVAGTIFIWDVWGCLRNK